MKDLTNQVFGRLTVIGFYGRNKYHHAIWLCRCVCGNEKCVNASSLSTGKTRSCGCLNDEQRHKIGKKANRTTHGLHGTRIYRIWKQMKTRCYNHNTDDYMSYGKRGIKVCDEWKNSFSNFYEWALKSGYDDTMSIDRIDVNGDYRPDNCRWSTMKVQQNNKRSNHFITIDGETKTAAQWIEETGISHSTFYQRLRNGKSGQDLISKPRPRKRVMQP